MRITLKATGREREQGVWKDGVGVGVGGGWEGTERDGGYSECLKCVRRPKSDAL